MPDGNDSSSLPVVQALWIGESLSDFVRVSIHSFIAQGHPYHLYAYKRFPDLPPGCIWKDANEILPEKLLYRRITDGSVASFSDWFRYELLYKKGGYYVDVDVICLKPFDMDKYFVAVDEGHGWVNGAILRVKPGNKILLLMLLVCRFPRVFLFLYRPYKLLKWAGRGNLYEIRLNLKQFWRQDFPLFFRSARYIRSKMGKLLSHESYRELIRGLAKSGKCRVLPRKYFYPVKCYEYEKLFDDTYAHTDNPFPESYAVHMWYNQVRQSPELRDQLSNPRPDSFWGRWYGKFLPGETRERPDGSL